MSKLAINGGPALRKTAFPAWPVWGKADEEAVLGVLRSGVWGISEDPASPLRQFEEAFARTQQAAFGLGVFNGTVALQATLMALGIGLGDEVIVPPYTFLATASACLMVGALPVFVDVDPRTYTLDPALIEAAITPRTRAVIAVHIGGCPADLDAVLAVGREHGLAVIEDACQAHAAAWNGRRVGAIGDAGCFSFQSSKNLSAGEGGMIVTDDKALLDRCWSAHNCGRVREGAWYQHEMLGGNYRMTQWQAGILLAQLRDFEAQSRLREENGRYLARRLAESGGLLPQERDPRVTQHGYHLFISRYQPEAFAGVARETFLAALQAEGIPCAAGYRPLYRMNAIREGAARIMRFTGAEERGEPDCPVTERACNTEGVWFGQSMLLGSRSDMDDIAAAVLKIQENAAELRGLTG
jgi:dTDP-4-amino-4,6-dideoxygalactose transaminase